MKSLWETRKSKKICHDSWETLRVRQDERMDKNHWYNNWWFHRPICITGVFDDYLRYETGESVTDRIIKNNTHFLNELHRRVYKKSKKRIIQLCVVENGFGKGGFHTHTILETPEHLSTSQYSHLLHHSWMKTRYGVSSDVIPLYDEIGFKGYLTKEISPDSKTGVDVKNSHCNQV